MKSRSLVRVALCAMACLVGAVSASAQLPPASALLPPGFTLTTEKSFGPTTVIEATKPNVGVPKPHQDNGVRLSIRWDGIPGAERNLEMLAAQPEEPAQDLPGGVMREEPCGKTRYLGGLLTCRRTITRWVGIGKAPDLVTLSIAWTAATPSGIVGVGVSGLCGSRATAMGLIDGVIAKIQADRRR